MALVEDVQLDIKWILLEDVCQISLYQREGYVLVQGWRAVAASNAVQDMLSKADAVLNKDLLS